MSKAAFLEELFALPETVKAWPVGAVGNIALPGNVDDSLIAMGKLSYNINEALLKPLSGMDLTELLLRVGQSNSLLVSMLLASLESITVGSLSSVEWIDPQDGYLVPAWIEGFRLVAKGAASVVVSVDGQDLSADDEGGGVWLAPIVQPLSLGKHLAIAVITYPDASVKELSCQFEVVTLSCVPSASGTYKPSQLSKVVVTAPGLSGGKVSIFGRVVDLYRTAADTFEGNIELAAEIIENSFLGVQRMGLAMTSLYGGVIDLVVDFTVEEEGVEP